MATTNMETVTVLRIDTGEAITTLEQLRKYISDLKGVLNTTTVASEEYNATLKELTTAQNLLRGSLMDTSQGYTQVANAAQGLSGSYNALVNQMAMLKKEWRSVDTSTQEGMQRFNQLSGQINTINNRLKEMDAATGNYQRNVGGYSVALTGVSNAAAQVVRELPSLTVSANQFFLAISNNLPILYDSINRLRQANAALIKEGKQGFSVLGATLKSFISWNTLIVVSITLLTQFGAKWAAAMKQMLNFNDVTKSTAAAMKEVNKAVDNEKLGEEIAQFRVLAQRYREVGESAEAKQKFIEANKSALDDLAVSIRNVTEADDVFINNTNNYIQALKTRAQAQAALTLAEEKYAEVVQKQIDQDKLTEKLNKEQAELKQMQANLAQAQADDLPSEVIDFWAEQVSLSERQIARLEKRIGRKEKRENKLEAQADAYVDIAVALWDEVDAMFANLGGGAKDSIKNVSDTLKAEFEVLRKQYDNELKALETRIKQAKQEAENEAKRSVLSGESSEEQAEQTKQRRLNEITTQGETERLAIINAYLPQFVSLRERTADAEEKLQEDVNAKIATLQGEQVQTGLDIITSGLDSEIAIRKQKYSVLQRDLETAIGKLETAYSSGGTSGIEAQTAIYQDYTSGSPLNLGIHENDLTRGLEDADYDERMQDLTDEQAMLSEKLALYQQYYEDLKALYGESAEELAEVERQMADTQVAIAANAAQQEYETAKENAENQKELRENLLATMDAYGTGVSSILDSVADVYEANGVASEEEFEKIKALRIASATIETITGALAAFMQAQTVYAPPFGTIIGAVNAAAVLAAGVAQIAKIKAQTMDSSSTGSSATATSAEAPQAAADVAAVRNITNAAEEDAINTVSTGSQRVYILQSDLEASSNDVKTRVAETTF